MNKEKALRILGLTEPFTKEELIKRYRILVKENHPDYHPDKTEIMQEINYAKEYLEKNYTFSSTELIEYKKKKLEEFKKFVSLNMSEYSKCFLKFKKDIEWLFKYLNDELVNNNTIDFKEGIDSVFNTAFFTLEKYFKDLKYDYFNENYIDDNNISINYDCNVQEFYDQLLKIKYSYSREVQFIIKITEAIQKYSSYIGYSILEEEIDLEAEKIIAKCKASKYRNQDNYINEFNNNIDILFKKYFDMLSKINAMEEYFENMYSNEVLTIIYSLYSSSISIEDISKNSGMNKKEIKLYCELIKIKNRLLKPINKIQECEISLNNIKDEYNNIMKINELKLNEKEINEIYNRVLYRYHSVLSGLSPIDNFKEKEKMADILRKVFEIFELVVNGSLSLDSLYMLDNITFVNFENDNELLSKIKPNGSVKDNSISIYVDFRIGRLKVSKNDKCYYFADIGEILSDFTINNKEFYGCITIEEYLEKANYLGLRTIMTRNLKKYSELVDYLYEYNEFVIFRNQKGNFEWTTSKNAAINPVSVQKITELNNKKEFLNALRGQINRTILEYEEKQNRAR